jgi:hypothetical protein
VVFSHRNLCGQHSSILPRFVTKIIVRSAIWISKSQTKIHWRRIFTSWFRKSQQLFSDLSFEFSDFWVCLSEIRVNYRRTDPTINDFWTSWFWCSSRTPSLIKTSFCASKQIRKGFLNTHLEIFPKRIQKSVLFRHSICFWLLQEIFPKILRSEEVLILRLWVRGSWKVFQEKLSLEIAKKMVLGSNRKTRCYLRHVSGVFAGLSSRFLTDLSLSYSFP